MLAVTVSIVEGNGCATAAAPVAGELATSPNPLTYTSRMSPACAGLLLVMYALSG
jgi:hypothetical protein